MKPQDFKNAMKTTFLQNAGKETDPVAWIEANLGFEPYSNQIENIQSLFSPKVPIFGVVASRGAGKCVDGDVLLSTGEWRHISKVVPGERVVSLDEATGKFVNNRVLDVIDSGEKEAYLLRLDRGLEVVVSKEHPFLTDKGWRTVGELSKGDFIASPRNLPKAGVGGDMTWAKLLGYLIGDGCCGVKHQLSFTNADPVIVAEFQELVAYLGGTTRRSGKYGHIVVRLEEARRGAGSRTNPLITRIREEGLNVGSADKFIPAWVFTAELSVAREFIRRLYATDGWASVSPKKAEIGYCSVSKRLAYDLAKLLLRFGLPARVTSRIPTNTVTGRPGKRAYQVLLFDRDYVLKFCDEVGIFSKEAAVSRARVCVAANAPTGSSDFIPKALTAKYKEELYTRPATPRGGGQDNATYRAKLFCRDYPANRRAVVQRAAEVFQHAGLQQLVNSDLYWDKVREIRPLPKRKLWDLSIENTHNFICGGVVAHNSIGVSAGLVAFMCLHPGLRVIIAAPKAQQAGRLIKEMVSLFKDKRCKVTDRVDWSRSSAYRIQMKDGGYVVALSGQEGANVEGEHGHILVIDEAHLVPSYSVTNKLTPMIGMLEISKVVKIGVAMGRNHFYKTCTTPNAVVNICPWHKAEIFLSHNKPSFFYKKKQYAKALLERMPLPYKKKYFPDRPDLQALTGMEISSLDWETQYELEWADDISNFLRDEDQDLLADGEHQLLAKGMPGELYTAGLDTAQGSLTGRKDTDETVLSIWRLRAGLKEKVATFIWKGDPLGQMDEIWQVINPETGLFKVKMTLVDYSNIGISIVEIFKRKGMAILGKHFQQTEKDSKKNWKNAMFDHFLVQLETEKIKYPNIKKLEDEKISATGEYGTQVRNALRSFWEWTTLQRIRGGGLNDFIGAPDDNVEDGDGESSRAFDDATCFTGDTKIKLLSGGDMTIEEMANSSLEDTWVYSLDAEGNIKPGKVSRAWKTGEKPVVRVTLDSGESFRCTRDHRIMRRDGSYVFAGDLVSGDSLMPLYLRDAHLGKKGRLYEQVYCPKEDAYEFTHRVISPAPKGQVVHHANFNRRDNRPTNLKVMGVKEHISLHGDNARDNNARMWAKLSPEARSERARRAWAGVPENKRLTNTAPASKAWATRYQESSQFREENNARLRARGPAWRQAQALRCNKRWENLTPAERSAVMAPMIKAAAEWHKSHPSHRKGVLVPDRWLTQTCQVPGCGITYSCRVSRPKQTCSRNHAALLRESRKRQRLNHKVVSVVPEGTEAVFDITVDEFHNFALSCGVFVHNCADVLAVWALDKMESLRQEMAHGGDLSDYQIPFGTVGGHTLGAGTPQRTAPVGSTNPIAARESSPASTGGADPGESSTYLSSILGGGKGKRR